MCETCGCSIRGTSTSHIHTGHREHADGRHDHVHGHVTTMDAQTVDVLEGLLADNDARAAHNRAHFDQHGVLAINLMSSPGAGKTALLERTIDALKADCAIAVVEGDLETENDARRIRDRGVPAVQITTGSACHLDAAMVHDALHALPLAGLDLLFIENVGNLVCPASFDLGQHRNVTLLSSPEGDDKPAKYPVMFRVADAVVMTKSDLLPLLPEFSVARASRCVQALANPCPIMNLSAKTGEGFAQWIDWLQQQRFAQRERNTRGATLQPQRSHEGARLHSG